MKLLNVILIVMLGLSSASAAIIQIPGDGNDQQWNDDGSNAGWIGQPSRRLGLSANGQSSIVIPFLLPVLAPGETVVSADFQSFLAATNDYTALSGTGIDIYGVRMASTSTTLTTDHFSGAFSLTESNGVGIQENYIFQPNAYNGATDPLLGPATYNTDASGDAALGNWIASLYEDAAYNPAGTNYAFIRMSTQGNIVTSGRYYTINMSDSATDYPILTLTTAVPEPAAVAAILGGIAVLFVSWQRRRRLN